MSKVKSSKNKVGALFHFVLTTDNYKKTEHR